MPKNPVTTPHFNPDVAAAARNKALELANGVTIRLVMIRPDIYVVMNSATHVQTSPKVLKRLRKEHGRA